MPEYSAQALLAPPVVLYDANPLHGPFYHQEIARIVGGGGANPCAGTFTATSPNPKIDIAMLAGVYGGALVNSQLLIGTTAASDPTVPLWTLDPTTGLAGAAAGVSNFQRVFLPSLTWEQASATFAQSVVFGKTRGTSALTPGTRYVWQIIQVVQAAATSINVGTNPVTPGISPDDTMVWIPNSGTNTVTPVSLGARADWLALGGLKDVLGNPQSWYPVAGTPITVGTGPFQCRVSPNGAYVAVGNHGASTVTIINAATKAVVATTAGLGFTPGVKNLAWSSDSTVVWVSSPTGGTIVPVTAATGAIGTAVTIAAGHNLFIASVGGTTGWVVDLTSGNAYPLSGMTGGAVTVGGAIALPSLPNMLTMSPADGSLWVAVQSNHTLTRVTTAGVQSTTALAASLSSVTGMAITADGLAIWITDFTAGALIGFGTAELAQTYYTIGGPVAGAYGVVLSATLDDIIVTRYTGNQVRVWPGSYITCGTNSFPPNQGVSVIGAGLSTP